jgi:hypothetical protein
MLPFDSLVLASSSLFSSCIRAWKRHRSTQYHLIPQDCIVADYRRRHMRTISKCRVSCRTPALLWRRLVSLCRVCTCRSCSPTLPRFEITKHRPSPRPFSPLAICCIATSKALLTEQVKWRVALFMLHQQSRLVMPDKHPTLRVFVPQATR